MKKPSLEDIAEDVDISQEKGIFFIPECIRGRRVLRYFFEYAKKQKEHPMVILEEKYTRQSVMHKIGDVRCYNSNRNIVIALLQYNLLRTTSREESVHHGGSMDNLSLAQVISYAYQVPIEDVLIPKSYFSSKNFKRKSNRKRIRTLYNAYTGTSWFERFKRKYKRRKSKQKFTIWHNVSTADLPRMLCTSPYEPGDPYGNMTKLMEAGFIIPKTRFKRFSPRNFVNVEALIELASIVTGQKRKLLINEDTYLEYLAHNFLQNRLFPYLEKNHLHLNQDITLEHARTLTGKDSEVLCKALKIKPDKTKRFYSSKTLVPAIDFAIYTLKNTHKQVFDSKDVANLFGVGYIDLKRCNLKPNPNGTYARLQKVFPLYEVVANQARNILNGNSQMYYDFLDRTHPTKTFEQIVRENNEMQRGFDMRAKKQINPKVYF